MNANNHKQESIDSYYFLSHKIEIMVDYLFRLLTQNFGIGEHCPNLSINWLISYKSVVNHVRNAMTAPLLIVWPYLKHYLFFLI